MADISDNTVFFQTDASNTSGTVPTWAEGMVPSQVNDSARALQGALKRFHDHIGGVQTSAGSANAQTLTYTIAPTAYVAGDCYAFIVGASLTNTGAATLNVNGLGAKNIWLGTNALVGGELRAGHVAVVRYDGTQFQLTSRAVSPAGGGFTPANPTGTASATAVMMGLGSTATITPKVSGNVYFYVCGDVRISTVAGNPANVTIQFRWGTGGAPANGAADTGTAAGSTINFVQATATNDRFPFTCLAFPALTVGTAHWVDLAVSSATANTASIANIFISLQESPR